MSKEIVRVIIAGGRDFNDFDLLVERCDYFLNDLSKKYKIIIVSGTANGADKQGERYAKLRGYDIESKPADWDKYKKAAGYIRNKEMAVVSQYLIAFHDGSSRGTASMISLAEEYGLKTRVVDY